MKKILISGLFLHPGKVGGAEHYFYNLLEGFLEIGEHAQIDLILNEQYKDVFPPIIRKFRVHYIAMRRNRALYDYRLPLLLDEKYDVYFSPNYIATLPMIGSGKKFVTTLHDLQYLNFPQFFTRTKRIWQYISHLNMLIKSDVVICISEFVRQDVIKHFGQKYAHKLRVIHNPIDFTALLASAEATQPAHDFPYILSVAAQFPHKNILNLMRAFTLFNARYPEVKLVLVGQLGKNLTGGHFLEYGTALIAEAKKNPNIIVSGYVSSATLSQLYQQCALFAFPSLFEGFGMPPIEAMGIGKPVITTRSTSLPEVTLNKAIYIDDPGSVDELCGALLRSYEHLPEVTAQFSGYAAEIRANYSIQKIATEYMAVLGN